ncbi:MAG: hydrogenase maturation protease [Pseudomonadota bacterium]
MKYIIGLGSMMRGDDGIGSYIIEYILNNGLEQEFYALDFASNAWGILPLLKPDSEKILIIDCSHMQEKPGTATFFSLDSIVNQDKTTAESHESSIAQLVKSAEHAGYHIPSITIMGIEPDCLEFEISLSAVLKNKLADYAQQAIHFIQTSTR